MQLSSEKILSIVLNGPAPSYNAKALGDFSDGTFL